VIDARPRRRATCIAAGGRLISRGVVPITNRGSEHRRASALLVEYGQLRLSRVRRSDRRRQHQHAKTPDVETYVGQAVGDCRRRAVQSPRQHDDEQPDVSWPTVKAESPVAQASDDNTSGTRIARPSTST
jgi:hypothetical protein